MPDPISIGTTVVGVAAALAAWASSRAASKASKYTADVSVTNARTTAEQEAYTRARTIDERTIKRLEEEIDDTRRENDILRKRVQDVEEDNQELRLENSRLRRRVTALEAKQEERE